MLAGIVLKFYQRFYTLPPAAGKVSSELNSKVVARNNQNIDLKDTKTVFMAEGHRRCGSDDHFRRVYYGISNSFHITHYYSDSNILRTYLMGH